ncbi:MAG: short-chain dehydrogenase, partial [Microbacterium sp.]
MIDPSTSSGTQTSAGSEPDGQVLESGIDPAELAIALKVLAELDQVDQQHPDYLAVRRGTANMFKAVKRARRKEIRDAIAEADKAVVARTATGAPDRIDDETRGLDLETSVVDAPIAGELLKPRNCYICKQPYTRVDAFYHQLCPDCARSSHGKRDAHADLTGKRA